LPIATGSIDRLDQVPDRLRLIFRFDAAAAAARPEVRAEFESDGAKAVARAFAEDLASSPRLVDKDLFRAAAQRVREKTRQKGRALFHPIRVALTGAPDGPELDLLVPAIDHGAELPPTSGIAPIIGARERARAFVAALGA
jgi:nondiscriminating glutamyl-tRNA synthetase